MRLLFVAVGALVLAACNSESNQGLVSSQTTTDTQVIASSQQGDQLSLKGDGIELANQPAAKPDNQPASQSTSPADRFVGTYVTEDYEKRAQGHDWVMVNIEKQSNEDYQIKIHSRSDLKKPSCTFNGIARSHQDGTLRHAFAHEPSSFMTITMKGDAIDIWVDKFENRFNLMTFCNGGASLAGEYQRLKS